MSLIDEAYDVLAKSDAWLDIDDPNDFGAAPMAAAKLQEAAWQLARSVLMHEGCDLESSASRQHYIDTGRYLRAGEQ